MPHLAGEINRVGIREMLDESSEGGHHPEEKRKESDDSDRNKSDEDFMEEGITGHTTRTSALEFKEIAPRISSWFFAEDAAVKADETKSS